MISLVSGDSAAQIDLEQGFACPSFVVGDWHVLAPGGMCVQFPWVGARAAQPARLQLGHESIAIGGGPGQGLASAPWTLGAAAVDAERDCVRAHLVTSAPAEAYPFELSVSATWLLNPEGLRLALEVSNRSRRHAPFGIGIRVHLARLKSPVDVLAPAEEHWQLAADGGLAHGSLEAVGGTLDFRRPARVAERVGARLTRRHFANQQTQVAVLAPLIGREIWLNTSADFRELEVDIEPDGAGVVESATCVPSAFALHAAGLRTGLRVLAPGESWRGHGLLVALSRYPGTSG